MTDHYEKLKVAVFNDTRCTLHYGCEIVMQTIVTQLNKRNIDPVFFWPVGKDWRTNTHIFSDFHGIDAIIVNGEGSIHHSNKRERAHYLTEIARFFDENYGIPSFLINTTVDEIGDDIIENLRYFRKIWVRESASKKILEAKGITSEVVPDLTFMVEIPLIQQRPLSVLVTDSIINSTFAAA